LRAEITSTQLGEIVSHSLSKSKSGIFGQVVASFRNSFYVRTGEDELVFVTNGQMNSPITINLASSCNFQELTPLDSPVVHLDDRILVGESIAIQLTTTRPYETKRLAISTIGVKRDTLSRLAFIIGILDITLSVLDAKGISYSESRNFARNVALALRGPLSHERFEREALALVGLGPGFTPSGDDLLGGFLATWNTFAESVGRTKILLRPELLSSRTSWISAKLLDHLQRQLLDSQLTCLMESAALGREDEFLLASEGLLSRGHTSGLDLATGIGIGLSLILDISTHTPNTESLLDQLGL
jgi:hypothetical protein